MPSVDCDLDHLTRWADGGPTTKHNLAPACSHDNQLKERHRWTCQRLPNGNTVVSSYHAKGDSVKLFEITREKKVVWRYSGMDHGFHHFQILTTNGKAIEENTWK